MLINDKILLRDDEKRYNMNNLKQEHIKILNNIKNPTITKVIKLSDELNIDIEILAEYFINKTSNEIEEENKK